MPTLPEWASGGRIIWDNEHGLAFVRYGLRRSPWRAYVQAKDGYTVMEPSQSDTNLERLRDACLRRIGDAIGEFVLRLHPGADYKHLRVRTPSGHYTFEHACGISYATFQTAESPTEVDCPLCLAVLAEDLNHKVAEIGPAKFEERREYVRAVRMMNAFGKVVGEDPDVPF